MSKISTEICVSSVSSPYSCTCFLFLTQSSQLTYISFRFILSWFCRKIKTERLCIWNNQRQVLTNDFQRNMWMFFITHVYRFLIKNSMEKKKRNIATTFLFASSPCLHYIKAFFWESDILFHILDSLHRMHLRTLPCLPVLSDKFKACGLLLHTEPATKRPLCSYPTQGLQADITYFDLSGSPLPSQTNKKSITIVISVIKCFVVTYLSYHVSN